MAKVKKATKTTTKTEPQPTRIPPPPANVGSVTPLYGNQALSPVLEDDGSIMGPESAQGDLNDGWGQAATSIQDDRWGSATAAEPYTPGFRGAFPGTQSRKSSSSIPKASTSALKPSYTAPQPSAWKTTTTTSAGKSRNAWGGADNQRHYDESEESEDEGDDEFDDDRGYRQSAWSQQSAPAPRASTGNDAGWRGWSEEARKYSHTPSAPPPSRPRAATAAPVYRQPQSRNTVSPQQQTQILNSLLSQPGDSYAKMSQKYGSHTQHTETKTRRHQSQTNNGWGAAGDDWGTGAGGGDAWGNTAGDAWGTSGGSGWGNENNNSWGQQEWDDEDDDEDEDDDDRRVHFSPRQSAGAWGDPQQPNAWPKKTDSTYSIPSKTFAYASQGISAPLDPRVRRNTLQDYSNLNFIDSKTEALLPVKDALFGRSRKASERIHWMFPSDKDQRVASLLSWIESQAYHIGAYGLHRFLQSRERGAFLANADYRPPSKPEEPALDWLTFDQLQKTHDKILQESVAFYDPAVHVILFVFLPSKSGRSVAMWRRKINVPNNLRLMLQEQITISLSGLRHQRDYEVHVDEIPPRRASMEYPSISAKKGSGNRLKRTASLGRRGIAPPEDEELDGFEPFPAEKKKKRKWWKIFGR